VGVSCIALSWTARWIGFPAGVTARPAPSSPGSLWASASGATKVAALLISIVSEREVHQRDALHGQIERRGEPFGIEKATEWMPEFEGVMRCFKPRLRLRRGRFRPSYTHGVESDLGDTVEAEHGVGAIIKKSTDWNHCEVSGGGDQA
jgi:hypothetical protein